MGLVIQHNTTAMTAKNRMKRNVTGLKKASEKLASGYQINRAADNASGLAVSEKMRSQIRGLSQATNNANDGISLIQTADGALGETHDILQRMRELSVQSANGTYTDEDRLAIQQEVDALKGELSRISESTEFNEVKLLDGTLNVTINAKVKNNEYGALYGNVCHNLAIGGGKISVTGSIAGMYIDFTTGASGKGGENAYWDYDVDKTDGELTQHVTVNLAEGEIYTDADIQRIIDKATTAKPCVHPYGKITFKSETGFIVGAEATTYGIDTGEQIQILSISTKSVAKTTDASEITYTTKSRGTDKEIDIYWGDSGSAVSYSDGVLSLDKTKTYTKDEIIAALTNAGAFNNTNKDENGNAVDSDGIMDNITWSSPASLTYPDDANNIEGTQRINFKYTENYTEAKIPRYEYYSFTLEADDYGSFNEAYDNEKPKYNQPDCYEDYNHKPLSGVKLEVSDSATNDIECSVDNHLLTITLKEGFECTDSTPITDAVNKFLKINEYDYKIRTSTDYTSYDASQASPKGDSPYIVSDYSNSKFVATKGTVTGSISQNGFRTVERVGTMAGERQVIESNLLPLIGAGGDGSAIGSSDHITFTAKTYGKATDYDSLVESIDISTDVGAGEEYVEINGENAFLHLSTGVEYADEDIEALLNKAGLEYEVTLNDKINPDGDRDGYVFLNRAYVGVSSNEIVRGKGVGFEDISVIKEGITFQIGANGTEDQQVTMLVEDAGAEKLGVASLDVTTVEKANESINKVDEALKQISQQRAELGALQNRLSHSVNSLKTSETNLTAAESQIRDTDIATEMITHTKNNILQQASQAMLSQANKQTEGILQLLG